MIVAVPKETFPGERRVALVPASVSALMKAGLEVRVEAAAGTSAGYPDTQYSDQGATIVAWRTELFSGTDVILQVRTLGANPRAGRADLDATRDGQVIIGLSHPLVEPLIASQIADKGATLFALDFMPRITRAQNMDVLSSMATIAGYKAVLLAANHLQKVFPLMTTAAGTLHPAHVLVIGAGVAGLQAIATARRLGAVVQAYDVRPAVKEQIESLGAKFVELGMETALAQDQAGYAKAMSRDFYAQQRRLMTQVVKQSDVVITSAAVPDKKAPVLITTAMVESMAPGSVIIDMAADQGGNCQLTQPDKDVVISGVTILGPTNLASTLAHHASLMYSNDVSHFLLHLLKEGQLNPDLEDPIVRETLVTRAGQVVHPRVRAALDLAPLEAAPAPKGSV